MEKFNNLIQSLYDSINSSVDLVPNNIPLVYLPFESKISFEFYDDSILFETKSVFRKKDFSELTNMIFNMTNESVNAFTKEDLSKIQKISKFGKWIKPNKRLGIVKSSFSDFNSFLNLVRKLVGEVDKQKLIEPYSMFKLGKGMYMVFSEEVGILFVNYRKTDEEVLCHELIHFFQDVTGQGFVLAKENEKFNPVEQLARFDELETFGILKKEFAKIIINEHEIIPYINSICYLLEKNKVNPDVPLKIINSLIKFSNDLKRRNGILKELKDAIRNNASLAGISGSEFAFLVICLMHGQHLTLLKRTIGNYFKNNS